VTSPSGLAGAILGPLVLPGVYTVILNAVNRQLKGELRMEGDPRMAFPEEIVERGRRCSSTSTSCRSRSSRRAAP
jgi:hypothetical protein